MSSSPNLLHQFLARIFRPVDVPVDGWGVVLKDDHNSFIGSVRRPYIYRTERVAGLAAKAYAHRYELPPNSVRVARFKKSIISHYERR